MRLCDLTFPTPEENLACDEALLNLCEAGDQDEVLRFWQPNRYFVALGYSNSAVTEVNVAFCRQNTIPILRRCTGGGTVLQGPGCLNYSLILRSHGPDALGSIPGTNDFVLRRHLEVLGRVLRAPVEKQGHADLAIGGLKFSGNAQRRARRFLLFHGSFLLNMDLELIEKALPLPSRRPEYRLNRSHRDFLLNLKAPPSVIKLALGRAWNVTDPLQHIPFEQIGTLVREKYSLETWNLKF